MENFVIIHEHKYGQTVELFKSENTLTELENKIQSVCGQMGIDFEPEKDETINLFPVESDKLRTVEL